MVDVKLCKRCQKLKEVSEFYFAPTTKDHYQVWCKQCFSDHSRERRRKVRLEGRPVSPADMQQVLERLSALERTVYELMRKAGMVCV